MTKLKFIFIVALLSLCNQSIFAQQKTESKQVEFPNDFPTYTEVSKGVIAQGNLLHGIIPDGPFRTILNDVAYKHYMEFFEQYKSGKIAPEFPDSSEILLIQYRDIAAKVPGALLVMNKNPEFNQTGGWGWQGYLMPSKKTIAKDFAANCSNCHVKETKIWDNAFFLEAKKSE